jgi:2-polyprenyl-3-methyl-5-hydroxy-6-metoxy-1,4-benzoquinol methylase
MAEGGRMSSAARQYEYRDPHSWSSDYVADCIIQMASGSPGPVLDLGCGNGALVNRLLAEGFDAYGVDNSISGVAQASNIAPGRFWRMNIEHDELPRELREIPFRTVISTEVIEHLYNPRALIALAKKLLRASGGGVLILSTPYHGYLKNLLIALLGRYDQHHTALWDGGHIKFFSRRTLETMITEQGFAVEQFRGIGRAPLLWKSMAVLAQLTE